MPPFSPRSLLNYSPGSGIELLIDGFSGNRRVISGFLRYSQCVGIRFVALVLVPTTLTRPALGFATGCKLPQRTGTTSLLSPIAQFHLPQSRHGLHPPEHPLHHRPSALTHCVTAMPCRTSVHRTPPIPVVLRQMRRHLHRL